MLIIKFKVNKNLMKFKQLIIKIDKPHKIYFGFYLSFWDDYFATLIDFCKSVYIGYNYVCYVISFIVFLNQMERANTDNH